MVSNTPKIYRMGYISNPPPLLSIEKPFSKTPASIFKLGMDYKLLDLILDINDGSWVIWLHG